jgi:hypothetical protein
MSVFGSFSFFNLAIFTLYSSLTEDQQHSDTYSEKGDNIEQTQQLEQRRLLLVEKYRSNQIITQALEGQLSTLQRVYLALHRQPHVLFALSDMLLCHFAFRKTRS